MDQDDIGIVEQVRAVKVIVDTVPEECKRPHQVLKKTQKSLVKRTKSRMYSTSETYLVEEVGSTLS